MLAERFLFSLQVEASKASYFDLVAQPSESIRSKKSGEFVRVAKPPRSLKVSDDWEVKLGDVLSWSEGRPTETFLYVRHRSDRRLTSRCFSVTEEKTLLKNPDTSGSGYLTIPLSITGHFPDALNYFSVVLDQVGRNYVSSIELGPGDAFFASNFSKTALPAAIVNRKGVNYSFDPNDEVLHVSFVSDRDRSKEFPLKTTKTEEILRWIESENETQAKFTVSYDFQGKDLCSKAPRGIIKGLPGGWQCEQEGSLMFGTDQIQGAWKCQGPEKSKANARKAIDKFYHGFNVEIK